MPVINHLILHMMNRFSLFFLSLSILFLASCQDIIDPINDDSGTITATINTINTINTTINTPDNKCVLVPNTSVWGQIITNSSANRDRRVDLVFGIGYDDDMRKARDILLEVVGEHELVLEDPEPVVRVHELADSSVNLVCRPWVRTEDYWEVYWDLTEKVKAAFDANGISIPYPQQDVHFSQG